MPTMSRFLVEKGHVVSSQELLLVTACAEAVDVSEPRTVRMCTELVQHQPV